MPELVVARPLLGIREDVVGGLNLVESLGGVIAVIQNGMVLPRQSTVSRLDLVCRGALGDAQDLVMIAGTGHEETEYTAPRPFIVRHRRSMGVWRPPRTFLSPCSPMRSSLAPFPGGVAVAWNAADSRFSCWCSC